MPEVKWIKIKTDIFDDEKILMIETMPSADAILVIWFKLLILAGKANNAGVFILADKIPYTEEMLASVFRREVQTVRMALGVFERLGMIELVDGVVTIPNWQKHQSLDAYDTKKERDRLYSAQYRAKQKQIVEKSSDSRLTRRLTSDDRRLLEEEGDKDLDNIGVAHKRFTPPTIDEVKAYCQERNNTVDPERFVDFYTSKGWKIGANSMKDWKAAVRSWEKGNNRTQAQVKPQANAHILTRGNDYFDAIIKAETEM